MQAGNRSGPTAAQASTKTRGDVAEDLAQRHLEAAGLRLVERNYRLAGGPRVRGAEIDLIMREPDGTLVFVEVRSRRAIDQQGGAAASVTRPKQQRIVRAAHHYLMRWRHLPPCRFDVVAIEGSDIEWLRAAFSAA